MPIKDYKSTIAASQSVAQVQQELLEHGATGFLFQYEKGTGRIEALQFILDLNGNKLPFKLPVDWRAFQRVLKAQNVSRWTDEDYCYRVAWRNIFHWVESQMALLETQMVTLPQIFLPYFVHKDQQTHFEKMLANPQLLLD